MPHPAQAVTACRCGVGYIPPEADQGATLTTAADIYQFGGLCYYMATGLHPPPLADAAPLPEYVPEQWRLMVSLCRAAKPVDRPTLTQLQLHLHGLCQPAPTTRQLPANSAPAMPDWEPPHEHNQELSAFALSQKGLHASEAATSGSSAVLPRMAANLLFLPGTASAQTRTAERKATAARAARATNSVASTQKASADPAQGLGITISVPRLVLGVDQWFPEESIRCVDHSQGTPSSYHAAAGLLLGSQQSHGRLDADMGGGAAAVLQSSSPGQDSSIAPLSIHGAEAASLPMGNAFRDRADSTHAGCADQRSAASDILRAVAYSHNTPDRPRQSMSELSANGVARSSAAALRHRAAVMPSSKSVAALPCGTGTSSSMSALNTLLRVPEENTVADSRQTWEADMEQLVSPSRLRHSQGFVRSPMSCLPPRRDDTAPDKGGMARWIARAQGKAADFAASMNQRAAGVAEHTTSLLQHCPESQI